METLVAYTNLSQTEASGVCPVLEHEGSRIQLKVPKGIDVGSAIKIEAGDTLSLGEVSDCYPDGDGYVVCVELLQALHNVAELSRLARALLS
jgi:hypothetical protein